MSKKVVTFSQNIETRVNSELYGFMLFFYLMQTPPSVRNISLPKSTNRHKTILSRKQEFFKKSCREIRSGVIRHHNLLKMGQKVQGLGSVATNVHDFKKHADEFRTIPSNRKKWKKARSRLLDSSTKCCKYCDKALTPKEVTVDHVIPLIKGGDPFNVKNLVISCEKCNLFKGSDLVAA